MQCGAKCFVVEIEQGGQLTKIEVKARSTVQARKTVKLEYNNLVQIKTVKQNRLRVYCK